MAKKTWKKQLNDVSTAVIIMYMKKTHNLPERGIHQPLKSTEMLQIPFAHRKI